MAMGGVWGAPLLLLCWLCCWPGEDTSSTAPPTFTTPTRRSITEATPGSSDRHRRTTGSLHLPGISGHTEASLSAHRSHEETEFEGEWSEAAGARYHSAPSVLREVLHRRVWGPAAEERTDDTPRTCKKHFTNIKCSKPKEGSGPRTNDDGNVTDTGAPRAGEEGTSLEKIKKDNTKETKQIIDQSIRAKEIPHSFNLSYSCVEESALSDDPTSASETPRGSRSGAAHCTVDTGACWAASPASVEPVGYDGGACYLLGGSEGGPGGSSWWGRVASDGDILAPRARPESGAFSESAVDGESPLAPGALQPYTVSVVYDE